MNNISTAVGSPKLQETYKQLAAELKVTTATSLIQLAIDLDHFRSVPLDRLFALEKELQKNHVGYQVLRYLVWKRLAYLPIANRATRQQLCERFSIRTSNGPIISASIED